jgi:GntR family transcriptional regulator
MTIINSGTRLQQVKTSLLNYISQNHLQRNDQLPSEATMAKMLGVSRNTLREAYISLENEGVIIRRHGIGTFVAQSSVIRDSLNEFSPFAQIIQDSGYTPAFQTIAMRDEIPPADVRDVLKTSASETVPHLERLVLAGQRSVIYVNDYFSPFVDVSRMDWDTFDGKMVQFLATVLDTPLHQIQSSIRAAALSEEIASYLELEPGAPILSVRSTIYTVDNRSVMYSEICFNSDIVEFNIARNIRAT